MLINKKLKGAKNIVLMAAGMLLAACNGETPKEESITDTIVDVQDSTKIIESEQGTSYSLPSPLKIASIFQKSGLKYKPGVTSQFKNTDKYITKMSKALNLGVYSADLSYCVLNKQTPEIITYMKLCREIADDLGMGVIYERNNLLERIEKNIARKDSLALIISELKKSTDIYLDENNQKQITSIVFAGAWIESLYIASKVSSTVDSKMFNQKFSGQMTILASIIEALKAEEKKDPNISILLADLQKIKDSYDTILSKKVAAENVLTDEEIASLTEIIAELRSKFISG